uniref:calcium-dependent protein kinase 26-like n=1 Tax=Erigeron canadensis TaxID=72917 RepID=UPI001CB979C9|nr:calcium-dependent protein kinase 26-like [Erigeron canadensis]
MSSSSSNSIITTSINESKDLVISFQVIQEATKNFSTVIGKGRFGFVYKAQLLLSGELTSVAVKRLDSSKISSKGLKEFLTKIQLLSRYKHPNLVSLLGFCDEAGETILIYEYAEHGSLVKHLLGSGKITRPLTWEQRISICLDTARGLDYLHNHIVINHGVMHTDIKSANILIGHNWKAMIADLGLSNIGRANESDSYLITNASGTHGYCDPAYMHTGILTNESDVYSFGVVMYEVLCGRSSFVNVNNEHQFLAPLAQRYYETGRLHEIIDPYLKMEVDHDTLKSFSEIAYSCLLNERERRPSMGLIVQKLEDLMASSKVLQINLKQGSSNLSSSEPNGPKKGNLNFYGNSNEANSVLGHKTGNIHDMYTFCKMLRVVESGTIYLCTEIATGIDYACKIISKRNLISKTHLEEVRREIQIMHHLAGHNNVVTIKGAYENLLYVHIVMELCNGDELFDTIIEMGHYTEKKAAELIKIIAGVVEACHSLGVIHRNFRPEYFLLVNRYDDFSLMATDFRSAIFCKPGQIYTEIAGSACYAAPEMLLGNYGPEADVWSAGVILYMLLSGVPPFLAETEKGIYDQVLKECIDFDSAPWPHISDCAKDLVRKMLCLQPSDRLTAYEVLSHPWLCEIGVTPERLEPAILSRMKQFSAMNALKKMALVVIVERLCEDEIAGLTEMFKSINTSNSGAITFDELGAGLRKYGSTLEDIEIRELLNAADLDNSGKIAYRDFLAATIHLNTLEDQEHLVAAFQYFDKDGSGYITADDLQKACEDNNIADFVVEDIIKEVDQNNEGRIGYREFVAMMRKGNEGVARRTIQNS